MKQKINIINNQKVQNSIEACSGRTSVCNSAFARNRRDIIMQETAASVNNSSKQKLPNNSKLHQSKYPGKIRGTISLQPFQDRNFEPAHGKVYQANVILATYLQRKHNTGSITIYKPPRICNTKIKSNCLQKLKSNGICKLYNEKKSYKRCMSNRKAKGAKSQVQNKKKDQKDILRCLGFKSALLRSNSGEGYDSWLSNTLTPVAVKYLSGFDQNSLPDQQQSAVKRHTLRKSYSLKGYRDVVVKQLADKNSSVRSTKPTLSVEQPSVTNAASTDKGQGQHQANSIVDIVSTQRKMKYQTKINDCKIQTPTLERTPTKIPVMNTNGPSGADDMTPFLTQKTLKPLKPPAIPEQDQEASTQNMNETNGQQQIEQIKDQKAPDMRTSPAAQVQPLNIPSCAAPDMRTSPPTNKQSLDIPLCAAPIDPETTQSMEVMHAIDGGQPRPTRKRVRKMRKKKSVQQLIKMSPFCETSPNDTMHKPSQMLSEHTSTSKQGSAAVKGDSISTRQTGKDNNSSKGLKFIDLEELRNGIVQCRDRASISGMVDEQQHVAAVAAIADDLNNNNIDCIDPKGFDLNDRGATDATVPEIGKRSKRKRRRGRPQQQNRNSNVISGNVYGLVGGSQHGLCKATLRQSTNQIGLREISSDDETLVDEQISLYDQMFAADNSSSVKSLGLIYRRQGYLVHSTYLYAQPKGNNSDQDVANANRQ